MAALFQATKVNCVTVRPVFARTNIPSQDTLYAKSGYQYYSNCYIQGKRFSPELKKLCWCHRIQLISTSGAIDYIFGDASAWFTECKSSEAS